jgi:hypothetical protein
LLRLQIPRENRMNVHKNARLTPHGRERIVRQIVSGQTPKAVGEAAGVCARTVRRRERLPRCTLDSIFELAPIVREQFGHFIGSARHVAAYHGPKANDLTDVEFI